MSPQHFVDAWSAHYNRFSGPSRDAYDEGLFLQARYFSKQNPKEFIDVVRLLIASTCKKFGREVFAAGPLEDFLVYHGDDFLDQLAILNASDKRFALLLRETQDRSGYSDNVQRFIDHVLGEYGVS